MIVVVVVMMVPWGLHFSVDFINIVTDGNVLLLLYIFFIFFSRGKFGPVSLRKVSFTIQISCFCVEKFAFWLVIYIKHSIMFTVKQQFNKKWS